VDDDVLGQRIPERSREHGRARRHRPDQRIEPGKHVGKRRQPGDPLASVGLHDHRSCHYFIIVIYIVVSCETGPPGAEHGKRGVVAEKTLNLRGLKCPLPALRARKALTGLKAGDILIAECTDPLTAIDIPNLLNQTGDQLESSAREGDVLVFRIRKR
jgi:tRNA 2-thiouridine synthesizing protein A